MSYAKSESRKTISRGTHVREIWFLEFSLESFVPALMHSILLETVDAVDNFISSRRHRFFCNSINNCCHLFARKASRESAISRKRMPWGGVPLGDLSPFLRGCAAGRSSKFSGSPLGLDAKYCVQSALYSRTRWHDGGGLRRERGYAHVTPRGT